MTQLWHNLSPIYPWYFSGVDIPWINRTLKDYERFVGKSRREAQDFFRLPPSYGTSHQRVKRIIKIIEDSWPVSTQQTQDPRTLRMTLFMRMSDTTAKIGLDSTEIVVKNWYQIAANLKQHYENEEDLKAGDVDQLLFSDLPSEQFIHPMPSQLNAREIILLANQSHIRSLLARSRFITLSVSGHARAVMRQIKLKKLLVSVRSSGEDGKNAGLVISGPLALFRQTRIYARSLSSLIPVLAWCPSFTMEIFCPSPRGYQRYMIQSGDPIFPGTTPREFDSKVEQYFAKRFGRLTKDWNLIREPAPIALEESWIFPDFEIVHRHDHTRRWLIEIVGYWTPDYLKKKITQLKEARLSHLILCVDQTLGTSNADWLKDAIIIQYKKRVNPKDVLHIIQNAQCSK